MSRDKLPKDWITSGLLDAEYKQYLLLAWLKHWEREFRDVKIYPALGHLTEAHRDLKSFQKEQKNWRKALQGPLQGLDFASRRLIYRHFNTHPELQKYLDELLAFSLPQIEKSIATGRNLYEIVEEHLELEPIGIQPLYRDEGYLFVFDEDQNQVNNYRYTKSRIILNGERHVQLSLNPIEQLKKSWTETFEQMKLRLARQFPEWPNPAVFLARVSYSFPLQQTTLPVAKRRLVRFLMS
ncbi:MAG: hypothetical protein O2818_06175 [Bacteroidetes bacterium]|nr:hypothetical protein [Bacteroidota bacterium]